MNPKKSREQITKAIEAQLELNLESVPGAGENWVEAGLDSLGAIDVCLKLEESLEREIRMEDFADDMTTEKLTEFLHKTQ